jgi:hypothetical protein
MRNQILAALKSHARGHIDKHLTNIEVYLNNPVGVGEHPDILEAIEQELKIVAEYQDQLDILDTYFTNYNDKK